MAACNSVITFRFTRTASSQAMQQLLRETNALIEWYKKHARSVSAAGLCLARGVAAKSAPRTVTPPRNNASQNP